MNLLTDEHVPPAVANALRSEGVDAVSVSDTDVVGKNDPAVLRFASKHDAALLTNDRDFVVGAFVDEIDHWGFSSTRISAPPETISFVPSTTR